MIFIILTEALYQNNTGSSIYHECASVIDMRRPLGILMRKIRNLEGTRFKKRLAKNRNDKIVGSIQNLLSFRYDDPKLSSILGLEAYYLKSRMLNYTQFVFEYHSQ